MKNKNKKNKNQNNTHKPKGNKFSYMKAFLLAISLIMIVNCSDNDNNTPAKDTTVPTVSSGMTADAMTITLTVSETVSAAMAVAGGDFTIAGVATPTTVSTVAVSGTTITLTLSPAITHLDMMPTVSYVPGDNRIADAAGNELAGFNAQTITNNLTDTTAPTISSGITTDEMTITLTMSETVSIPAGTAVVGGDFTIVGGTTNPIVDTVVVSGTTITLTLSTAMTHSDTPHVSYTVDDSSIKIKDAADNELTNFSKSITNNLMPPSRSTIDTGGPAGTTIILATPPDMFTVPPAPADTARATYTATDDAPGAFTTWEGTGGAATARRTIEYQQIASYDKIGAAYAHARGYSGAGIIVSAMGREVNRQHVELFRQLMIGYTADTADSTSTNAGTCNSDTTVADATDCTASRQNTHLASTIAGERLSNSGLQGIAYSAKIKPIDIYTRADTDALVDNTKLRAAIGQASGSAITVMNNGWDVSGVGTFIDTNEEPDLNVSYRTANRVSEISDEEIAAWKEAVKTTVVVFGAGDYGHNSENGRVQLYQNSNLTGARGEPVYWAAIDGANRNIASSHARLPLEVEHLQGMWLTVIALDEDDNGKEIIWETSNGCGDALSFCLGAPGVEINSADAGYAFYLLRSGTAQAAAHVSAALAVVKEAFPSLSLTQLVHRILDTADYLRATGDAAGKTDGTNEVYGHGALNLAKATEPDSTAPTISSAKTVNTVSITLEMSESVYGTDITADDFTIAGVTPAPTVFAVASVSGRTIKLILSAPITGSDTLTVSYTAGTPSITDAFGNTLGNFGPQAITNNL